MKSASLVSTRENFVHCDSGSDSSSAVQLGVKLRHFKSIVGEVRNRVIQRLSDWKRSICQIYVGDDICGRRISIWGNECGD